MAEQKTASKIEVAGEAYDIRDARLDSLLGGTLVKTGTATYWVPDSTDKEKFETLTGLTLLNLAGSVASREALQALTDAKAGDIYLIPNAEDDNLTEEWVRTQTTWQMLGIVKADIDVSGKADKTEVVNMFNSIRAEQLVGTDYKLVITRASINATSNAIETA